ncbi:MAG: shikimate dehydrogenase [Bacteroidota bacterium]
MKLDFGLVGKTLGHSFSRTYFSDKFREEGFQGTYHNFEMPDVNHVRDLEKVVDNLRGFNVTIPYKRDILTYLDELSPVAESVGAVNTVLLEAGRYIGYNTDVVGFRDSLTEFYEGHPGGKALILGTGGASRAVGYVLEHYFQFDEILHASRSPRADNHVGYPALKAEGLGEFRLIVNSTPVGTAPDIEAYPDLPYESLNADAHLYDLIYNPRDTKFLQLGAAQGCKTMNGMEMLIRQAEASWEIWMEHS